MAAADDDGYDDDSDDYCLIFNPIFQKQLNDQLELVHLPWFVYWRTQKKEKKSSTYLDREVEHSSWHYDYLSSHESYIRSCCNPSMYFAR